MQHKQGNPFMNSSPLIIGYGNPLCGDDGIGVIAAERLEHMLIDAQIPVQVITAHQLLPEMVIELAAADFVLFIDAAVGETPGEICFAPIEAKPPGVYVGHTLTPATLIGLAQTVYGTSPAAVLVTITGGQFDLGAPLSAPVSDALPNVIQRCASLFTGEGAFRP